MIKSIFTNSFGILFSRVLGFVRDLFMASVLGANIYSDIFFVAFKLPNLFRRIFGEGAFTQAFIPAFASSNHKVRFSSALFLRFLAIIIVISIFVSIFSYFITLALGWGFSDEFISMASPFVAINFYYLDLIFIVTFLGSILQYKQHFATTAFSTALLNISLIVALIISKDLEQITIVKYLSWAVIVGGVAQVAVHIITIKRLNQQKLFFALAKNTTKVKEELSRFNKQFVPAVFGNSTSHISAFLDTWLASFLVSGSISYLYYANRLFQFPLALFAIATSIALFPTVAKAIKQNNENKALKVLKRSFWLLLGVLSLSSAVGILFSDWIVWLLFQRGAFDSDDTTNTSIVLIMYLIGLIPFGLSKIFSLWLYSHQKQLKAAKISAIALGFNILLSLILISPLGASGLALASSLSGFILFYLTIKEFGWELFHNHIIKSSHG